MNSHNFYSIEWAYNPREDAEVSAQKRELEASPLLIVTHQRTMNRDLLSSMERDLHYLRGHHAGPSTLCPARI